jgi:hypothetical protein
MKLRALRRPEIRLHAPPPHNANKRVRFARVFFGRNRVFFWTQHRILKQVSSTYTALMPRRGDSKGSHSVLLHEEGRQFETNE